MSFLVKWVPLGCFGLSRVVFMCVCVCGFFDLLSLLVIHLCKHCHYQPQDSLWLTVWYLRYFFNVLKPAITMGAIYYNSFYMTEERKKARLLQDKKIGPRWNLKTDLFDHKLCILINWLCEESAGVPKKDVVTGTFIFLLNEKAFGRYNNSRGKRKVNRSEDLVLRLHSVVWEMSQLFDCLWQLFRHHPEKKGQGRHLS